MVVMVCLSADSRSKRERQGETDDDREPRRHRQERFLPVAPRQELEREQAQAAREVRGEEDHEPPFGRLHERPLGPREEPVERGGTVKRLPERPEVER